MSNVQAVRTPTSVRAERRRIGWNQLRLAIESGVSLGTVRAAESRGPTAVRRTSLEKIATALGLHVASFLPPEVRS